MGSFLGFNSLFRCAQSPSLSYTQLSRGVGCSDGVIVVDSGISLRQALLGGKRACPRKQGGKGESLGGRLRCNGAHPFSRPVRCVGENFRGGWVGASAAELLLRGEARRRRWGEEKPSRPAAPQEHPSTRKLAEGLVFAGHLPTLRLLAPECHPFLSLSPTPLCTINPPVTQDFFQHPYGKDECAQRLNKPSAGQRASQSAPPHQPPLPPALQPPNQQQPFASRTLDILVTPQHSLFSEVGALC